jgi:predicted nuclease of predicted toxin-antitoxin system
VNLFVDRDLGKKLGRALRAVGVSVTLHIDRYPNADAESVPDRTWIAEAARRGEVILTRDGGIRREPAELDAVKAASARCFVLETGNATPLDYLRAVMIAWPEIERHVAEEVGPFMYALRRNGRLVRRYP